MSIRRALLVVADAVIVVLGFVLAGLGWLWYDYLNRKRIAYKRPFHALP